MFVPSLSWQISEMLISFHDAKASYCIIALKRASLCCFLQASYSFCYHPPCGIKVKRTGFWSTFYNYL